MCLGVSMGKGLIEEGECIDVAACSAWPSITGFPNSFTNNRHGRRHHNTKQVRKPNMSKNLLAFTRLSPQISDPRCFALCTRCQSC